MASFNDYFNCLDTFDPKEEPTKTEEPLIKPKKEKRRKRKFAHVPSVPVGKGQPSPCEPKDDSLNSSKWEKGISKKICRLVELADISKRKKSISTISP